MTTETKFTPGPWEYETHELSTGFSSIVYGANGRRIADHLTVQDARLTAAAPEMYEALKTLTRKSHFALLVGENTRDDDEALFGCNYCGRQYPSEQPAHCVDGCPGEIARAALAKAEGDA